ncbi:interphotoreceptor matrix proteoglycan 2 isoform X2 [Mugil cephalus]|uniref:interphotoreceptor matrix proteoglycan 2 isoform X2 n=1 Tax=Mugil cephalus TaxID=48193 RepID=UPI001FB67A30|nr:interphotoreceptor matrix proteoglycan 2 isoform X2 [Mugil cephalus]
MNIKAWRCVFYSVVFSLVVIFLDIRTDASLEGSSMGYLDLPYTQESVVLPHLIRVSEVKAAHEGHAVISRRKRNILFPSGVKLCTQETAQQAVANHLSYFHLRVCQETIWEAFKIFWDRLPEQDEYQSWMSRCQEGTVTAQDIGSYFSQSEEHQALVEKRMSMPGLKSEPTRSWQHMCSTPMPAAAEVTQAPELEDVAKVEEDAALVSPEEEEDSPLDNDIALQPPTPAVLEQVVELSIILTGETYSDDLKDPASLQYQTLSRQLAEKIEDALEGLPGFKSVSVISFRPDGVVVVDYAVTVVVDGAGVSGEQLDYLTLQSNRVENSYREIKEPPTVAYTISEVKNVLTDALHYDEPETVSEVPESVNTADGATVSAVDEPPEVLTLEEDIKDDVLQEPFETNTAATAENDVTVLEESVVVSPPLVLTTIAPEADGIEEEGLLLEDIVQTPAAETPPREEIPADLPGSVTLPEPPVEMEASGSGTEEIESLLEPSTVAAEEDEASHEETTSVDVLLAEEIHISTHATSVAEAEKVEVAAVGEEPTASVEEVVENEVEIPEELEVSTISTETTEEEQVLPALVPSPETIDTVSETSEPEAAETDLLPVGEEESDLPDVPPGEEEVVTKQAEEDAAINVVLEEPVLVDEPKHETVPEAPLVDETTETPVISTEDLTEDEILLVNIENPEPSVTDSPSPAQTTALSPEKESPFTRVSDVGPGSEGLPDIDIPSLVEIQTSNEGLDDATIGDNGFDVIHYGYGLTNHSEEGSTGFPFSVGHGTDQASIAMPINPGRALIVFFSLRVTNMAFSEDLFNKSSPEYKALEQRFIELLVPYLQSNLSHFENLEILNFRNGSIVVNSRMKFGRPVARGVTTTVYLILEDFCNTAYQTMNLAIDKYSLDVESGDQADPCKFQACNEYAECKVNKWSGEAECVCNAGYFSVDGLPCQSICELQTDFCLNDGKCDIIPGQGAICRCRVGENWWYRGEHCEEYVSEPLVVGIAIASVAGFLLVASGVIFFLARTLRDQYDKDESEDPIRRTESLPSLERATKYNPMYESEATTGYSHYYRRYPEATLYSSASAEASTDFSSEEIRHIYENSELTKEEIQDRIRIIELYAKDRQFADFVRQHQAVLDTRRESSSVQA